MLTIDVATNDIAVTAPIDETGIVTADNFTFSFSAEIPDPEIKAGIESQIANDTMLALKNHRRQYVKNPEKALNGSPDADALKKRLQQNTNHVYIMVHSLVLADGAQFKLKKASSHSGDVSVVEYGKFKLKVTHACQGSLDQKAKQGPLFFKPVQIKLGADGQIAVANDVDVDLRDYDLIWSR